MGRNNIANKRVLQIRHQYENKKQAESLLLSSINNDLNFSHKIEKVFTLVLKIYICRNQLILRDNLV